MCEGMIEVIVEMAKEAMTRQSGMMGAAAAGKHFF